MTNLKWLIKTCQSAAPMPKPPFSAFLGLRGSVSERIMTNSPLIEREIPKISRKISDGLPVPQFVSNFVSTVDTSSIYDDRQPETRVDNNRVFHVLKAQTPKFDDYQSPELLPEHMIELKVKGLLFEREVSRRWRVIALSPLHCYIALTFENKILFYFI